MIGKHETSELEIKDQKQASIKADLAMFSFLKIIAKINKFEHILLYKENPKILEKIPNYSVKMGFGLHYGWAIEGAIGS